MSQSTLAKVSPSGKIQPGCLIHSLQATRYVLHAAFETLSKNDIQSVQMAEAMCLEAVPVSSWLLQSVNTPQKPCWLMIMCLFTSNTSNIFGISAFHCWKAAFNQRLSGRRCGFHHIASLPFFNSQAISRALEGWNCTGLEQEIKRLIKTSGWLILFKLIYLLYYLCLSDPFAGVVPASS